MLTHLAISTSYAVIYPPDRDAEVMQWFDAIKNDPDFDLIIDRASNEKMVEWTDDRSAITDLLPFEKLLHR